MYMELHYFGIAITQFRLTVMTSIKNQERWFVIIPNFYYHLIMAT